MSLFGDLFTSGYDKAATDASAGYAKGVATATPLYTAGRAAATSNYGDALNAIAPVTAGANTGSADYLSALTGSPQQIQQQLENSPGYQFNLNEGLKAIDRGAASRGLTTSGNTITAEQKFGAGLASNTYNSYLSALQPYLGQQTQAAALTAGVDTGLGNTLNSSFGNQGNLNFNAAAGSGNAVAAADTKGQDAQNSFINGVANLGTKLLGAGGGSVNPTSLPSAGFGTPFLNGGIGVG